MKKTTRKTEKTTGEKILDIADFLLGLCFIALIFAALILVIVIILLITGEEDNGIGSAIGVLLFSAMVLYISNLILRGYGEMVNNSELLCRKADMMITVMGAHYNPHQGGNVKYCKRCRSPQSAMNKFCGTCGMPMDTD